MIKATKLQEEYRRHLNRRNSSYAKAISVADGDAYLNAAIDLIYENLVIKFETTDLIRNHLRILQEEESIIVEKIDENRSRISLPEDYYKLLRARAHVCKGKCEKYIDIQVVQTSDINKTLKDPFWKPSFEWERLFGKEMGDYFILYHNCDFNPKEVEFEYLRKIKHIATPSLTPNGSYINSEGVIINQNQNFEIDSTSLWLRVAKLAAVMTLNDMGDVQDFQSQMQELLAIDKMFLT